ncbi:MAG: SDR family oxidoreductase [Gemmatimonadaceae bacterium]|nr:SDR family oxidoreductase [Gemmatimonadaceae bacterium]
MRTMIVTGGTGAIGAAVVGRLAAEPVVDRIAVLTRAPSGARQQRLLQSWNAGDRVPVVFLHGKLPELVEAGATLRADLTHIVHLAADTRFSAAPEESRAANVCGTAAVLDYARTCPRLAAMTVASTVYVAGLRSGAIRERELEHGAGFANNYEASKHEMEVLVRAAMGDLPLSVCRLSTAIGEDGTGEVTSLNAFHTALRLMYGGLVPMIPGADDTPIDVISTGFAAQALRRLATEAFRPGETYHVCAGSDAPTLGAVLDAAMRTMRARRPAWRKRAIAMPVLADEPTYELFVRSVHESGDAMMAAATRAVESFARQLTRPKIFDTANAVGALGDAWHRPDSLGLCEDVVRYCVENEWKAAA